MRAMVLTAQRAPLEMVELADPKPGPGQIAVRVRACGVCRTDLHVADGELREPKLPLVLGHEIVGVTDDGRRVGIPWLGWTCGECAYCRTGRENLCDRARFTGLSRGRWLCRNGHCRRAVLLSAARSLLGRRGRSAPVRGTDRPPLPADGRRCPPARHLWIRSGGAPRCPGREARGPSDLRVHLAVRCRGAAVRARARRGVGRVIATKAAGRARRRDHFRAGGGAGAARAQSTGKRRYGGLRRHPYERRTLVSVRAVVG